MRRTWTRRELGRMAAGAAIGGLGASLGRAHGQEASPSAGTPFRVWALGNANVETELFQLLQKGREELPDGRQSLAEALRQTESAATGFDWDVALFLGDLSGGRPDKREAREIQRQLAVLEKHPREALYCIAGDRDANPGMRWFERWVDPLGRNPELSGVRPENRPYPVVGDWDRYSFRVGNLLFLMMSDRNDVRPPAGRGPWEDGPYPAGATTMEAFLWWSRMVEEHREDSIVVTAHHHMPRETAYGTGDWEAFRQNEDGGRETFLHPFVEEYGEDNRGAGYLYWTWDDRYRPGSAIPRAMNFEAHMQRHPGASDLWLAAHNPGPPDAELAGRKQIERVWETSFVNCGTLARRHAGLETAPWSRLLTFEEGSDEVRVQCYLHSDELAPQGFHAPAEVTLKLSRPFSRA